MRTSVAVQRGAVKNYVQDKKYKINVEIMKGSEQLKNEDIREKRRSEQGKVEVQ